MGDEPETYETILEGALHALARRRPSGISMTDVAASAGVARGTVYRYFHDKRSLLVALAEYERHRYDRSLQTALADTDPGVERIVTLVDHTLSYFETHPSLNQLLDTEPGFVLDNLCARLPALQATAAELLGPALANSPLVRQGTVTARQLSDLLIRLLLSLFLLPTPDAAAVTQSIDDLIDALMPEELDRRSRMPRLAEGRRRARAAGVARTEERHRP